MSIYGLVPAAGIGQRMAVDRPKQYLMLHGRPVIEWSVQALLDHPGMAEVVVALAADDPYWPNTRHHADPRVRRVNGGAERAESVLNGLAALASVAADQDWVLVHDAARPCVRGDDIALLVEQGMAAGGAVLGVRVNDTMKRTGPDNRISGTVDRDGLWAAFTPQLFPVGQLRSALQAALQAGARVTDESSAMEWAGHHPLMLEGHSDNLKITRPGDLESAAIILENQGRA